MSITVKDRVWEYRFETEYEHTGLETEYEHTGLETEYEHTD